MPVENLVETLKARFGFHSFRPPQEEIIQHLMQGGHALVIMPTGGGKSICYQLPALIKEGFALVISPLISLMNDQVRSLRANGISAGALHSGTSSSESKVLFQQIRNEKLKILYVSPERVLTPHFLEFITLQKISLIAIDEVHCVSIWGNDFRPEYAQLYKLVEFFPDLPVIALTATADKATQLDILQQLRLRDPRIFLSGFERPNIFLSAKPGLQRIEQIRDFLKLHPKAPGIIYCLARKTTESVAMALQRFGYNAVAYHADMDNHYRKSVQEDFQFDRIQIVCATIAFGMGIDKPNIRWIIHYNLPKNIESYYQEIGRSGRDGQPAEALLFYSFRDVAVYKEFIERSEANETFKRVQREKLERIWDYSQATSCRTNVILNYFGEYRDRGCGHCDHCKHPPMGFDGTTIAQMALSACLRSEQSVGMNLLIDVLRGSSRREIYERRLEKIKTYGAGKEYSFQEWASFITQLINQGLLEIDYTNHSTLRCTPLSNDILFHHKRVFLQKQAVPMEEVFVPRPSKTSVFMQGLIDTLDDLCQVLAREEGIPAFTVFTAGTIKDMAWAQPLTIEEFAGISGVGEFKAKKYGKDFIEAIRKYMLQQDTLKKPKGSTYIETLGLFNKGMNLDEIAAVRNMAPSTVASHLARLYQRGEDIDIERILQPGDLIIARQGWRASGFSDQSKMVKEQVGDSLDYGRLHVALAILKREKEMKEKQ